MRLDLRGKTSSQLREIVIGLQDENRALTKKVKSLETRVSKKPKVKIVKAVKFRTKTEAFPEHRKVSVAKMYAKQFIDEKIRSAFNTEISDHSKYILLIGDFCSEKKITFRQLGILLYASNFRYVRKKDLHEGRNVGDWYSQTIGAMIEKDLIMRVNPEMTKWIYFGVTPFGEKVVRDFKRKVKGISGGKTEEVGLVETG